MKNPLLALILSALLAFMPLFVFAQEATDTPAAPAAAPAAPPAAPSDPASADTVPVDATPSDASTSAPPGDAPAADAPDTSGPAIDAATTTPAAPADASVVQDATSTQDAATADMLETTADPQATSTTETQTTVTEATTTDATSTQPTAPDASITVAPQQSDAPQEVTPIDPQPQLDVVASALPAAADEATSSAPVEFSRAVDPQFVIALSGKTIPTTRKDEKTGRTLQTLSSPVKASVDPDSSAVHLSGACTNTYFVVLLFKNQTDYDADPRSYILNKAFPCENGQYSYSIEDLPNTLANGTYYVLIGEEGDNGPWKPITSLTEITINRAQ